MFSIMKLRNFEEVHQILRGFISNRLLPERRYSLERIVSLMDYLGNPQNTYKTIHVAGTSGKTSTCYYLAAMLMATDKKVGLSVSPHVDEVNERAQINLKPLKEREYCGEFSIFLETLKNSAIKPTYFEVLVAFAFWEFKRAGIDYAVIEVGLGGLLDGTNVITRDDKVCVITDIGLDHIEVLGDTLPEIAAQKAGIIHPDNFVFTYRQSSEVMDVFRKTCQYQRATLREVTTPDADKLPKNLPLFQQRNWYLAQTASQFVVERDKLTLPSQPELARAMRTYIPARMEVVSYMGKTIIMDGAHNAQKLEALASSIRHAYPDQSVAVLASFIHTKQSRLRHDMEVLLPLAAYLITTCFITPGAPRDSIDPKKLVKVCEELGYKTFEVIENPGHAFQKLLKRPEPLLLVTGSFYLLNHIRPLIIKK